jgi:hypothetical protein
MILPVPPAARRPAPRRHPRAFTGHSHLSGTILRMISMNSLAAFTQEVSRAAQFEAVRQPQGPAAALNAAPTVQQRALEAVPPPPNQPLPRGSLLDLRV